MKATIVSIVVAVLLIGGAFMLTRNGEKAGPAENVNNVSVIDGKQVIEVVARGGYQPRKSLAKAGIPTTIRFITKGTFDCSSSVRIPSLDISKVLPQTGSTDIDVGTQKVSTLQGSCGMGMYPFEIEFQE
jgi:plastocyanin domain-containing protein